MSFRQSSGACRNDEESHFFYVDRDFSVVHFVHSFEMTSSLPIKSVAPCHSDGAKRRGISAPAGEVVSLRSNARVFATGRRLGAKTTRPRRRALQKSERCEQDLNGARH